MTSSIVGFILLVLITLAFFGGVIGWIIGAVGTAMLVTAVIALWHVAARGARKITGAFG